MSKVRKALVIGGTNGIGRAIAIRLSENHDVHVTGLQERTVREISETDKISASRLDVSDLGSVTAFVKEFGALDVLVNCAGTNQRKGAEFSPEIFEHIIRVNLLGTMSACYAAHAAMGSKGGAIINIGSMFSHFGSASIPAYAASKAAVSSLTKSLAIAWAKDNIRVNAIAPGFIETKLTQDVLEDDAYVSRILDRTPLKRWGQPNDLAGAAAFLCSEDANFVTGTTITVDGGYSIT